jgi:hypothetical protein
MNFIYFLINIGTFSDRIDLVSAMACSQCPEGYSCSSGATSSLLQPCPAGFYCPSGTAKGSERPCGAGRYSSSLQLVSSDDCNACPRGSYCMGGQTDISGPCAMGYYCPEESSSPINHPCPAGTFSSSNNLFDASQVSKSINFLALSAYIFHNSARIVLLVIIVCRDPRK